jgi:GNAT superfamily N-acetyltransferase
MTLDEQGSLAPMAREEVPHLTRLMAATFDADARAAGDVDSQWLQCYHCPDFFEKWPPGCVDADHYTVWVEGRISGAVVIWRYPEQVEVLGLLFVVPGRQRRGIGRRIWDALQALYPGPRRWMVAAPAWAPRSLRFYEQVCGFVERSRDEAYVNYVCEEREVHEEREELEEWSAWLAA